MKTNKSKSKKSVKKSAAVKTPKVPRVVKNGVTHPKEGGVTAKVWGIADKLTASTGKTALRAEVLAAADKAGLKLSMASTQYGYWRSFHGIKGRLSSPAKPKAPKAAKGKKGGKKAAPKAPTPPKAPVAPAAAPAAPKPPVPPAAAS